MRTLLAFNFITLDGYFQGPNRDISWHGHDAEEHEVALEGLRSESTLVFGRVTYELMAGYWPTPQAKKNDPVVADGMNRADKIVFSRTLKTAEWNNTTLVSDDAVTAVAKLKQTPGRDMALMGSGSIVTQLARHGLIDHYELMVNPVALGEGTSIFKGLGRRLNLKLTSTRTFRTGVVLLSYQPSEKA